MAANSSRADCFYPRAREGRDWSMPGATFSYQVSIRAPVKDATSAVAGEEREFPVSIRAPVKDATRLSYKGMAEFLVSIRAPVKDATPRFRVLFLRLRCFYPRAREGRDHEYSA